MEVGMVTSLLSSYIRLSGQPPASLPSHGIKFDSYPKQTKKKLHLLFSFYL